MANSSAKKVMKSNRRRLNILMLTIGVTNLLFGIIRAVILRQSFTTFYQVCWVALGLASALPFYMIWVAARPSFGSDGSIISGGEDITQRGVLEYAHDVIFLCAFVQTALIFSRWALIVLLVVPVYIIYFVVSSGMLSSFGGDDNPANENEQMGDFANMSRKERRKAERQARKQ